MPRRQEAYLPAKRATAPVGGKAKTQPPAASLQAETRLKALLEATPNGVLVVSPKGRVLEINPTGLEILEAATREDIGDTPVESFVREEDREAFGLCVEGLWKGEKSSGEFEIIGRKGGRRWELGVGELVPVTRVPHDHCGEAGLHIRDRAGHGADMR